MDADQARELALLSDLVDASDQVRALTLELSDLEEMAELGGGDDADAELATMAKAEAEELKERRQALGESLVKTLMKRHESDEEGETSLSGGGRGGGKGGRRDSKAVVGAIVEVRAGTGGDEAALFSGEIFDMYQKYSKARGWQVSVWRGMVWCGVVWCGVWG